MLADVKRKMTMAAHSAKSIHENQVISADGICRRHDGGGGEGGRTTPGIALLVRATHIGAMCACISPPPVFADNIIITLWPWRAKYRAINRRV